MDATYRFEPVERCVMCHSEDTTVVGRRLDRHQGLSPRRVVGVATTVVRCCGCGLIHANPRPVPENIGQHYEIAPEDYWSERRSDNGYFTGEIATFHELWDGDSTPTALDIGAGEGVAMRALDAKGFVVHGLEPSATFTELAIERGISPARLSLASIEDAVYAPGTFDFVTFGAVLEHLHDPADAIERALGWLAPGGLIHIEVPSARWLIGRVLNGIYRARRLDYVTNLSPMHPPFHLYEFTLEAFARHAQRTGYEVVFHRFLTCKTFLPWPLSALATEVMNRTDTGMQLQVWLRASAS